MNSFDIAAVVAELRGILVGRRIDNIYQTDWRTLLIKVRGFGGTSYLIIEAGRRIHLTSYSLKKPLRPPPFSMALRKHLNNGIIREIQQHEFERIIIMVIERGKESYRLISEFFSRGNIILVGSDGKIIHALTYRRMRDRNILRGETFTYPPSSGKNPKKISLKELNQLRSLDQTDVVRALTKLLSIGGSYAEEILLRAGIDKNTPCNFLSEDDVKRIFEAIMEIVSTIGELKLQPCIFIDEDGRWVDVAPIPLRIYSNLKCVSYNSFNEALDEYYTHILSQSELSVLTERVDAEIARLKRILHSQEEALKKLKARAEHNRKIGDIIYRHLNDLQILIERIMEERRRGKSWNEITSELTREKEKLKRPATYFVSIIPKNLKVKVSIEGEEFELDLRSSPQENAAKYYETAKKAKVKASGAERAISETIKKIEELKGRAELVEASYKPPRKRPKRRWYEKFRWFHSSDGFLVIGGRDASTNELLIKRYMEAGDVVLHTDIRGAPFVLVKAHGKPIPERTLMEAAQLAASYSKAWRERVGAVNVYWVHPEQVSKSPPSGEYLSKGSFMIYGKRNYIRKVPLEVAIGVKKDENGSLRVIGGPPNAITNQTNVYVKLVPGDEKSGRLAKLVRAKLAEISKEDREDISKIPLDEIQRFIPPGGGSISHG